MRLKSSILSLIVLAVFFSAGSGFSRGEGTSAVTTPTAEPISAALVQSRDGSIDDYSIILEKNIFGFLVTAASTVKEYPDIPEELGPLPPAGESAIHEPETPPDFSLTGIVSIGDTRKAIIESRKTGMGYYVGEGEDVNGYKVQSIGESSVVLESAGETIELKIDSNTIVPGPAAEPEKTDEEEEKRTLDMIPFPQRGRLGGPE